MRAEIISIGTEILVGSITNTNARFLSQRLAEQAVDVYHHVTVGDNPERLRETLETAAKRSDLIVTSGGLGPTLDDVTVRAAAAFLGRELVLDRPTYRYISSRMKKRGLRMNALVARQCYVPKGARLFKNHFGTAPGILADTVRDGRRVWLLLLPGPPRELEPMLVGKALPLLIRLARFPKQHFIVRSVKLAGLLEVQVARKVNDLLRLKPPVTVGIYAKPGEVELKIMSKAASRAKAQAAADRIERAIRKRFGKTVYGTDHQTVASVVGELLRKRKLTLSIAESCTGGLASHLLTAVAGSSDYYLGGVVCYSNPSKRNLLNVPQATLAKFGAVSAATARALALGAREKFSSDFGIGLTGIAGPSGGSKTKPVGLVFIAVADGRRVSVHELRFLGCRADIQLRAAQTAIDLLRKHLLQ